MAPTHIVIPGIRVRLKGEEGPEGGVIINERDFDASKHEHYVEQPKKAAKVSPAITNSASSA